MGVPWKDWVKINSYDIRDGVGNAGCGGLIRGNEGEWLGSFVKKIDLWKCLFSGVVESF